MPKEERKTKMASIRFTSFLLGFMLILMAVRNSIADSHRALGKPPVGEVDPSPPNTGISVWTLSKEIFGNGVPAAEVRNTRLGERKMMLKRALGRKMAEAEAGYGGASQISGASLVVGNSDHKAKRMLKGESKFSNRSPHPAVRVKVSGFVVFNADYHVPKPHPPKNN